MFHLFIFTFLMRLLENLKSYVAALENLYLGSFMQVHKNSSFSFVFVLIPWICWTKDPFSPTDPWTLLDHHPPLA